MWRLQFLWWRITRGIGMPKKELNAIRERFRVFGCDLGFGSPERQFLLWKRWRALQQREADERAEYWRKQKKK